MLRMTCKSRYQKKRKSHLVYGHQADKNKFGLFFYLSIYPWNVQLVPITTGTNRKSHEQNPGSHWKIFGRICRYAAMFTFKTIAKYILNTFRIVRLSNIIFLYWTLRKYFFLEYHVPQMAYHHLMPRIVRSGTISLFLSDYLGFHHPLSTRIKLGFHHTHAITKEEKFTAQVWIWARGRDTQKKRKILH